MTHRHLRASQAWPTDNGSLNAAKPLSFSAASARDELAIANLPAPVCVKCFHDVVEPPPKKSAAREVLEATVQGGAGMVPLVGSAVAAAFTYAVGYSFNQRMQRWYEDVATAIQELQNRDPALDFEELAGDPVFVDAVVHATRAAQGTHQHEKLDALRNAVVNSIGDDAPSADEQLRFLRLIDQFSTAHVRMLELWRDPRGFFEREGLQAPELTMGGRQDLLDAVPEFAHKPDWCTLLVSDLNGAGLMAGQLTVTMTGQGIYQSPLTDLGRRFLDFIAEPRSG